MPWEQTDNEIRHRLEDPSLFQQDSFVRKNITDGIDLILGKKKGSDSLSTQAIRFDKDKFNLDQAKAWMKDHKGYFSLDSETFSQNGVEIFSVGQWNGDNFSEKDLNDIVSAFNETKNGVQPYLKLGHNKEQNLLAKDGLPAAGWVDKIYVQGGKLLADFKDIPKKIYQLLEKKAYKKVSCEMFFNVKINNKSYPKLLTAVSLLGADTPAVMNLNDILNLYSFEDENKRYFEYEIDESRKETIMAKTESEIKLELDLDAQKKLYTAEQQKAKELEDKAKEQEREIAALKEFKANAEKQALLDAEKAKENEIKAFSAQLISDKLCTKAMQPLVEELLSDKKEFSVKSGDKALKTKQDVLKEVLKLYTEAQKVNFEESTKETKEFSQDQQAQVDKKIQQYIKDGKTYKQAYVQAMKDMKGC